VAQACPHENKTIDSRSPPEVDARSLVTTTGGAAMSSAPVRSWTPCRRLPILQSHLRLLWPICCVLLQVSAARDLLAGGNQTTGCANICPGWPNANPCVVSQTINVIPGSNIDCTGHDVVVSGGNLLVHDGKFQLTAQSLSVTNNHTITADCPQATNPIGFDVAVIAGITVNTSGTLLASCAINGGAVRLQAGGDVTLGGGGVNVNGTAPGAQGGFFRVRTDGNVNVTATIQAQNTAASGTARGGLIDLRGASISIAADLLALGTNERGGTVAINATVGDLIVSGPGQFNASASTSGDGGTIYLQAVGSVQVARRLRVLGVNSGHGGTIQIDGTTVNVTHALS